MPADLGEPSMKVPERPAGIVGTARPRALAMATKGVGRTRARDCCAQIAIVRAATLAVPERPTVDVATAFWAAVERSDDRRWRDLQRYEPIAAESGPSVLHDCFRTRCIHDSI